MAPVSSRPLNGNDACKEFVTTAFPCIQIRRPDPEAADHPGCLIASIMHCYILREPDKRPQPIGQIWIQTLIQALIEAKCPMEEALAEVARIMLMSKEQLEDALRQGQQEGAELAKRCKSTRTLGHSHAE